MPAAGRPARRVVTGVGGQVEHSLQGATPPRAGSGRDEGTLELEALLHLSEGLLGAPHVEAAAALLVDSAVSAYGFPRAALVAAADGSLPVLASHGLVRADLAGPVGTSPVVASALEHGSARTLRRLHPGDEPWLAALLPVDSDVLVVPVATEGRRYGALLLQVPQLRDERWLAGLCAPLERAAGAAARAFRTLWRMEHLQQLSTTDDLTMIANRRSFHSTLARELARSTRRSEPVSLVMLDLDGFKGVNDRFGHPAGDEALRSVAAALSRVCRDLDTPARYGGEEFAVILPDCGVEQSLEIAGRLRAAVARAPAAAALTASAGVATFPVHADDAAGLVSAADDALLVSKRTGRDRTTQAALPGEATLHLDAELGTALDPRTVLDLEAAPIAPVRC